MSGVLAAACDGLDLGPTDRDVIDLLELGAHPELLATLASLITRARAAG